MINKYFLANLLLVCAHTVTIPMYRSKHKALPTSVSSSTTQSPLLPKNKTIEHKETNEIEPLSLLKQISMPEKDFKLATFFAQSPFSKDIHPMDIASLPRTSLKSIYVLTKYFTENPEDTTIPLSKDEYNSVVEEIPQAIKNTYRNEATLFSASVAPTFSTKVERVARFTTAGALVGGFCGATYRFGANYNTTTRNDTQENKNEDVWAYARAHKKEYPIAFDRTASAVSEQCKDENLSKVSLQLFTISDEELASTCVNGTDSIIICHPNGTYTHKWNVFKEIENQCNEQADAIARIDASAMADAAGLAAAQAVVLLPAKPENSSFDEAQLGFGLGAVAGGCLGFAQGLRNAGDPLAIEYIPFMDKKLA